MVISDGRTGKTIIVCPLIRLLSIINVPGPDSGIVNFYQMKDTLMAHADRAEYVVLSHLPDTSRDSRRSADI